MEETGKLPEHHPHRKVKLLAIALLVMLSVSGGFFGGWLAFTRFGTVAETPSIQREQVILKGQAELISHIAETVGESVVSINVASQAKQSFFGFTQGEVQGAGTGILLTEDGLIVTNRHVVAAGTTKIDVVLSDGTEYKDVQLIGRTGEQDSLDVAFLKIKDTGGRKLKAAVIGDSSAMKVGDSVVAIGNALGQFQNTVTSGIISGYGRSVQASNEDGTESENLENLFQTDAAINQGNSGGPLVNLSGEVIGINTAVASGDAQSIGFAIPINDVAGLIKSVKEKGILERPFLGVVYIPLTDGLAKTYGLGVSRGAYIAPSSLVGTNPILAGGPADKAGLKEGDVIVKVDDKPVDNMNSLSGLINKYAVGDKVSLTVNRSGQELRLEAVLAAAPNG